MPYVSCEEAGCDYPDWCQSDHWVPDTDAAADIAAEAREYLEVALRATSEGALSNAVWEASGLLEVGADKVYVPARFLPGVPLKERSVPVSRDVAASLRRSLYDK